MPQLVAIDLEPSQYFIDSLHKIWDIGNIAVPIDHRLSTHQKMQVIEFLGIPRVIGPTLEESSTSVRPTKLTENIEVGDALVMLTSGTSGQPKGVIITHDCIETSSSLSSKRLEIDPARDWWICSLPLAHVGGLSVVLRSLYAKTRISLFATFDPSSISELTGHGANLISIVPTMLSQIDLKPFRKVLIGGSRPPQGLPDNAITTYGMTETLGGIVYNGQPLESVEVDVLASGEIRVRAPMIARSYFDGRQQLPIRDPNGWFNTGDIGAIDAQGSLTIVGRKSDMIISGGENIWPSPIEDILSQHPSVRAVGVCGVDDPLWGQRVVALIEVVPGTRLPSLEEIKSLTREELPPWYAPKEIVIVDELPRTSIGKIRRGALEQTYRRYHAH